MNQDEELKRLIEFLKHCKPACISFSVTADDLIPRILKEDWWTRRHGYGL